MNDMLSSRQKFFLSHLGLSLLISLLILSWVFLVWYPSPLAQAVGVTHIFLMLICIDVIVGPLLGFIVYKEGKKSLKFDLAIIILIQIVAMVYGVYTIAQGRPAWIVYNVDRFELVRNNEIILDHVNQAKPQYQTTSWLQPQFVAVQLSLDMKQRNDDMFNEALGGISLSQRPERYISLEQVKPQMQQRAQKLEVLKQFNHNNEVDSILSKYPQATAWLPLKANAVDMVVLVNKDKGEVVKIVNLRPWK